MVKWRATERQVVEPEAFPPGYKHRAFSDSKLALADEHITWLSCKKKALPERGKKFYKCGLRAHQGLHHSHGPELSL